MMGWRILRGIGGCDSVPKAENLSPLRGLRPGLFSFAPMNGGSILSAFASQLLVYTSDFFFHGLHSGLSINVHAGRRLRL